MKTVRLIFHGFILLVANMAGLIVAHILCRAFGVSYQLGIQVPLAGIISILLYLAWMFFIRILPTERLSLQTPRENILAGLCALLWNPIVFIPLHFFSQEYLTSAANIAALAIFQIPVNAIAIFAAWKIASLIKLRDGAGSN